MGACDLCSLVQLGERARGVYYEDRTCLVVECRTCKVPMAVLKRHTSEANCREVFHMLRVCMELFPGRHVDFKRRSIPEHYHFHMR